jgi:hypothetical protein
MLKRRLSIAVISCTATVGLLSGVAYALAPLPTGASATRVAQLVGASHKITSIPSNLVVPLQDVAHDNTSAYFKVPSTQCPTLTSCVYGSTTAKRSIVIFGDSHAYMWVPGVNPIAVKDKYKLILLYESDCPAASVTYWDNQTHAYATACSAWRSSAILALKAARPSVVLLASLTAGRYSASGKLFTSKQWQDGLESTISKLKSKSTKVAVIGDITTMNESTPLCLASYPTAVQKCASAYPNTQPTNANQNAAEQAAAKNQGIRYLSTSKWLCTTTCSPIVGNMIVYTNNWHITATYAAFLSKVMAADLGPLLTAR